MFKDILKSKFVVWLGVVFLLITVFYLAKQAYKKQQINSMITGLEAEIASVDGKNKEMLELISYYKTTAYKERQARSVLGLQKEGEFVVALPQSKTEQQAEGFGKEDKRSNAKRWWGYFFDK